MAMASVPLWKYSGTVHCCLRHILLFHIKKKHVKLMELKKVIYLEISEHDAQQRDCYRCKEKDHERQSGDPLNVVMANTMENRSDLT